MRTIDVATVTYRVKVERRDGHWIARAEHADTGDRHGVDCAGATEDEAVARLQRWLTWQAAHAAALAELQRTEHAFHRAITTDAFATVGDRPGAAERQKHRLETLEAARTRLDEIRAQKPE